MRGVLKRSTHMDGCLNHKSFQVSIIINPERDKRTAIKVLENLENSLSAYGVWPKTVRH